MLVVDDSAVVRQMMAAVLGGARGMTVAVAADPFIAMEKMKRARPDVIVLDLEMPRMDGLSFLRKIMAEDPIPVVVCSGLGGRGTEAALRALDEGAVEVVAKPKLGIKDFLQDSATLLSDAVRAAAQARIRPRGVPERAAEPDSPPCGGRLRPSGEGGWGGCDGSARSQATGASGAGFTPMRGQAPAQRAGGSGGCDGSTRSQATGASGAGFTPAQRAGGLGGATEAPPSSMLRLTTDKVVAVGASTGGTEALRALLTALPPDAPGLVIVQHMPEMFTAAFARRLNELCRVEVREASNGDRVIEGRALIAPGNRHTVLCRSGAHYAVEVSDGPLVSRHRPSVDVLFQSVARAAGPNAIGVILTGMGDDGADGLLDMRRAGAHTIAQDEASCVVFGMPKEAIARGAVEDVLALQRIPEALLAGARGLRRRPAPNVIRDPRKEF